MKRMKKYKIRFNTYHESFSGSDHCDGEESIEVEACNYESAEKKAKKIINKKMSGTIQSRWAKLYDIEEV
jgi:hypothetical protein